MMRTSGKSLLISGAVAAALCVGCSSNKSKDDTAMSASAQKYKILSGNTSGGTSEKDEEFTQPEPALNANTRFAAGQLAESQGKLDCAIVQYEQAVRLNPKHIPSLYRLGVALTKMQQYDKAVAIWERYIAATGNIASSWANLGFCYEMAADIDNAEKAYKAGLEKDSNSVACRVNYGLMLARNNRNEEAEAQLSVVLKPDEVAFNLASIYEQQGAIELARAELKRAIEANPKNTLAQQKLASLPAEPAQASVPQEPGQEVKVDQEPVDESSAPESAEAMTDQDQTEEVKAPQESIDE
jgi:tetratricopeptide (TPR) repeat protein